MYLRYTVSRPIYVAGDSPNLGFPYFLGGYQLKNTLYKYIKSVRSNLLWPLTPWRLPWSLPASPLHKPGKTERQNVVKIKLFQRGQHGLRALKWSSFFNWNMFYLNSSKQDSKSNDSSVVNLGFGLTYIRSNLLELGYWPLNDLSGKWCPQFLVQEYQSCLGHMRFSFWRSLGV